MTDVSIRIAGIDYLDFTDVSVTMGLEQFARTFRATFSDKFFTSSLFPFPFDEGADISIAFDGETVLDGFIDDIPVAYDATSHEISVTGRSWTGHLVDCSAIHKSGAWRDVDLLTIASDICQPFGLTAKFDDLTVLPVDAARTEKFRKFAIEDEETAFDCIARAAKLRGITLLSNEKRELILAKGGLQPQPSGATLAYGVNILRGRRTGRFQQRHSNYIVKSQNATADDFFGDAAKGIARSDDPQVENYRPLIVVSDGQGKTNELQLRADWERNVRAGRSRRVTYEVKGVHPFPGPLGEPGVTGPLWKPNTSAVISDPLLDIQDSLLLISATLQFTGNGTRSFLEFGRHEAFTPELPPLPRVKRSGGWAGW